MPIWRGWKLGLKALAVYRDGSKESQPLSTSSEGDKATKKLVAAPRRERLPDTRRSLTHKFSVAGHEGYITVGLYDDGRPGELFITMAKEGSTIGGLMYAFGTAVSMSLQYGVPLEVYVSKFSHTRFEPMGHTKNPEIRIAKSIVDYIFRWLGMQFIPGFREANSMAYVEERPPKTEDTDAERMPATRTVGGPARSAGATNGVSATVRPRGSENGHTNGTHAGDGNGRAVGMNGHTATAADNGQAQQDLLARAGVAPKLDLLELNTSVTIRSEQFATFQLDAPTCDNCGAITVRNGNCYLCHNCGNSMGCS